MRLTQVHQESINNLASGLKAGKIAVIPTDTIYGIVGSALDRKVVEKIYKIRKRDTKKPFIILIDSVDRIKDFKIKINAWQSKILNSIWPDKLTIIISTKSNKLAYLHRGLNKIAFRFPKDKRLISIMRQTGPLVAPSANISGQPPAKTIREAKEYFGSLVDIYIDIGKLDSEPSTILELDKNKLKFIREGVIKAGSKKLRALL